MSGPRRLEALRVGELLVQRIGDPWEGDLFEGPTTALFKIVHELTQLPAAVRPEAVQMTSIGQALGVCFAARDRNDLLVDEGLDPGRVRLVRFMLIVLGELTDVVQTQLTEAGLSPCKDISFLRQRHRVRVSTGQLSDREALQTLDALGNWHEGTPIHIERHLLNVSEAELSTAPATKAIDLSLESENHGVNVTTGGVNQFELLQGNDAPWNRLVRIAILIGWETRSVWVSKLSTCAGTPRVKVTIL